MTKQAIAHWCDGMGDYNNKLYRDEEYAKKNQIRRDNRAANIAEQHFQHHRHESGGLPGVHSFHSGWDWLWLKPIKVNETDNLDVPSVDIVEKKSEFALRHRDYLRRRRLPATSGMRLWLKISAGASGPKEAPPGPG